VRQRQGSVDVQRVLASAWPDWICPGQRARANDMASGPGTANKRRGNPAPVDSALVRSATRSLHGSDGLLMETGNVSTVVG
jgi:hypothetical protein